MGWAYSSTASIAAFAVIDNSVSPASFTIYNDVDLFAVWSPNVYTVTYQSGTHGTFTAQVTTNLHYGDQTPAAPTVTGDAGWTFTGWQPTPSTTVTSNTIYVAQWTQTITPSSSPSATTSPTPTPSTTASPQTPTPIPTGTPILTTIPTLSTPTSIGEDGPQQVWALVNLVLSIAGVILAIIVTLYALLRQKQKKEQQTNQKKQRQHRRIWLFTVIIAGIAGVIVFLLTEDMKLPMTMADNWTIINAIIFIIEIIAIILTFKRKKDTTNNKEQERSNTT